jgi:molybdenum cofactor cytidylyltransferase
MKSRLTAVVLAAGFSKRMRADKLRLTWQGKTILDWVLDAACALDHVVLVGNPGLASHRGSTGAPNMPCTLVRVESPQADTGQAESLKSGLAALPAGVAGAMVLLGDMPLVTPELVVRLAGNFRAGRFLVPLYQGRRGNPVIIPAEWFPKVMDITGDTGARPLLNTPGAPVDYIETNDPAVLADIDTPEDYSRLKNQP